MHQISFDDFLKVELRVGKIVSAEAFPEARTPAYILHVDFGEDFGVRKSSAQITDLYEANDLVGRLVVGVLNFSGEANWTCQVAMPCYRVSQRTRPCDFVCS